MKIPTSIRLMGHTVRIVALPPAKWKQKDCVGYFNPKEMEIGVLKRPGTHTEQAFHHELTHAILYCMGNDLYEDEAFVDTFAGLMHQAMTSAKFTDPRQPRRPRKASSG